MPNGPELTVAPDSTAGFAQWLSHTALSELMRRTVWAFATVEIVHLIAFTLLGAAVIAVALRRAGWWMPEIGAPALAAAVRALRGWALVVVIASGALLFCSAPVKYWFNSAFRWKLALLVGLISLQSAGDRARWSRSRIAALLSPGILFGVAFCGRLIGLI